MQQDLAKFALCPGADLRGRPVAFPDAAALARHIHRARGGERLQLRDGDVSFYDEPQPRRVVEVYVHGETSDRLRLVGRAWLGGRGRESLQAALERVQPQTRRRA